MAWTSLLLSFRLFYRRLGILLAGNVLWILSSLPLVTMPAATGALFYLVHRVILEERDLEPRYARISDFWDGFRIHWARSSKLFLLDVMAAAVLLVSLRFYGSSSYEPLRWLVGPIALLLLVWLGVQVYLFPLLIVHPEYSIWETSKGAFLAVLGKPLDTLFLLIWLVMITAVSILLAGPVLSVLFSFLALVQMVALRIIRVLRGEIPPAKARDKK